ncbi:ATP-dependent helicase HrpB [Paenibacillus sp. IHBB 10380]|uniref:ATP-dependent helicase HrpB n=1 Tax=Paenibacillus sp. IHBB 10380 TaxID=1566358 RepID=UPI0005CFBAC6|nr:ATP-dependent helicase HrpB [Paenibacillus sp. IHBB 10380]AJS59059.1 ATP-dependent helicase [Paenibacillus sp. IHBB 10380]
MQRLPITQIVPQLKKILTNQSSAVLIAEPGAGKTTQVPLALLEEPWLEGKKIIMLEPRRLAARSAAQFMARQLGESVGETVGYRVRMDSKTSKATRIEVVTEGILTRMLQHDQALMNVGLLIFDEFHERNIHGDLGLALALQSQEMLREDLRILIMSATIEAAPVAALLHDAPIVHCPGRQFSVESFYIPQTTNSLLEKSVTSVILSCLTNHPGHVLVFLPGVREIRRVARLLESTTAPSNTAIRALYGQLSLAEQDAAIQPEPDGRRKIVLATSIAETSLTIEGVRVVVDSGLMRTEAFSPRSGMSRLTTVKVSKAAADQRKGRAGRTEAGWCYRLWSQEEHDFLKDATTPEIIGSDLAPLVLELATWGVHDPTHLEWLDVPVAQDFSRGVDLLQRLGALNPDGHITEYGRQMVRLGMHPRLAHMMLESMKLGCGPLACRLAALLQERDPYRGNKAIQDCDVTLRMDSIFQWERGAMADIPDSSVDITTMHRILQESRNLQSILHIQGEVKEYTEWYGLLLSFAYPDRIGQNRGNGRFLLTSGRGVELSVSQPLSRSSYMVAAVVDDKGVDGRIMMGALLTEEFLHRYHQSHIKENDQLIWDRELQGVKARRRLTLGAIVIREQPLLKPSPEDISQVLLTGVKVEGLNILPWSKAANQYRERLQFMHITVASDWPNVTEEALLATLDEWLLPSIYGMRNRNDLQRLHLIEVLQQSLTWEQRRQLDVEAPTHLIVPSGSRIPIDYSDPQMPIVSVRLQEMFGLSDTPRIAGGTKRLTLHLLSPAQRPVQVTADLASFWKETYFDVKKDLKGRYPKHFWPDDPLEATPTRRAKPQQHK